MFFISFGKKHYKGKLTPGKVTRMNGLKAAYEKRASGLFNEFHSKPEVKRIMEEIERTSTEYNSLVEENMVSIKNKTLSRAMERKMNSLAVRNCRAVLNSSKLLLAFLKKNDASHHYIRSIEGKVREATDNLSKVKKAPFP